MDSLTPDKDDLERFRQERKKPSTPSTEKQSNASEKTVSNQPVATAPTVSKSSAWPSVVVLLLLIVVAAVSFWQILHQQATIEQIRSQLGDADQYMNQSKLLIARLQGNLNETEASVTQSGNELSTRLNRIESDLRKVSDVTNKRNLEMIKDLQTKVTTLEGSLKKVDDRLQALAQAGTSFSKEQKDQSTRIEEVSQNLTATNSKLDQLDRGIVERTNNANRETQAQMTALIARIEALNAAVAKIPATQNTEGRLIEVEKSIESIDATRRQVNQRIIDLERRLNETQLKVNALQPTGG